MKKTILFLVIQTFCWSAGFSENPRWKIFTWEGPIPARADLDVRWEALTNTIPPAVWVYRLLPNKFSPEIISNVVRLCSFSEKDKTQQSTNGISFQSADGSRKLSISIPSGGVNYWTVKEDEMPTNVLKGVPSDRQALKLAKKLLPKLGISLSDISKKENSSQPNLYTTFAETTYYPNHKILEITSMRGAGFRRAVDGMKVIGGDGGEIHFAERGEICRISISWHNLERYKFCPTVTREAVTDFLRHGKAYQGLLSSRIGSIDWPTAKSVTIKKVMPCYDAEDSGLLYPFLAIWTTVETGERTIDVEIDCPIIDESKL